MCFSTFDLLLRAGTRSNFCTDSDSFILKSQFFVTKAGGLICTRGSIYTKHVACKMWHLILLLLHIFNSAFPHFNNSDCILTLFHMIYT